MNDDDFDTMDELPAPPRKEISAADLELLQMAARALGAEFEEVDGEIFGNLHFEDGSVIYAWNSLEFSADAFELLVKLAEREGGAAVLLNSRFSSAGFVDVHTDEHHIAPQEYMLDHPSAATRRAITRAAAEIGRVMAAKLSQRAHECAGGQAPPASGK